MWLCFGYLKTHPNYVISSGFILFIYLILIGNIGVVSSLRKYTRKDVNKLREETREMFQHAYNGYLIHASDYDELRPLTCDGVNTWGSYSLTLIDSLDTLAVMGNFSEFRRVVDLLVKKSNFDSDINVSVFETNIRIIGGLLGAHLMQHRSGAVLEPGWPCNGPLLRLAEDVAKRLLPAFNTKTGMPYGTVNLKYGVPVNETSVTCTAGIGTFIIEFGALSRLTGDPIYEEVAMNAIYSLRKHMSTIGLYGNHIDVQTGRWTGVDSGIGAGVDSFYEYLVKGSIMLNRPELMEIFNEAKIAIDKYLSKNDWHIWASMTKGQVTIPVFQSLDAYWPGVLSLIGDIPNAMKSMYNYHSVWKQYGFLPEFYNIPNSEAGANREGYPLRPELIESVMYLYRATGDSYLLEIGEDMLRSIQHSAKTSCGFATIKNVRDHRKENRMESFFLAETTKYLYLLFDPDNFLNNDGASGIAVHTSSGECIIDSGGYIFNTEAHPIDPAALRCCHDVPYKKLLSSNFTPSKYLGDIIQIRFDMINATIDGNETMNEDEESNLEIYKFNLDEISMDNLNEWFSSDEEKTELLKFLDNIKTMAKKDNNSTNSKIEIQKYGNISTLYESLLEFGENETEDNQTYSTGNKSSPMNDDDDDDDDDELLNKTTNGEITKSDRNWNADQKDGTIESEDVSNDEKTFDAQRLLELIRRTTNATKINRNYELLSCKSQTFLQRLAVLGEMLT